MQTEWEEIICLRSMDDCYSKTRHQVQVTITRVWASHPHGINCPIRSSLEAGIGAGLWLHFQFNYRNNEGNREKKEKRIMPLRQNLPLSYSLDLA